MRPKKPMTPKCLRAKALDLLARRDHSEKELEDKLRSRGGESVDVAQVLQDLRGIGLLNDRRYAQAFLSFRSGKAWGTRRYQQELQSRGVAKEIIEEVMAELPAEDTGPEGKLRGLVQKELARGREVSKIVASLVRRGFSYAEVKDAMKAPDFEDDFPINP